MAHVRQAIHDVIAEDPPMTAGLNVAAWKLERLGELINPSLTSLRRRPRASTPYHSQLVIDDRLPPQQRMTGSGLATARFHSVLSGGDKGQSATDGTNSCPAIAL